MKHVRDVTCTWVLAQLLHPILFQVIYAEFGVDLTLFILVLGFLFSLPSYMLCLFCYYRIKEWKAGTAIRTLVWLLLSQACILTGTMLASLFFGGFYFSELGALTLPGHLAAAVAVLILSPLFLRKKQEAFPDDFLSQSHSSPTNSESR